MTQFSLLRAAGEALYGPRWQSELARALDVSDRTMRRWAAGSDAMPPGVVLDLLPLCDTRIAALEEIKRAIRKPSAPSAPPGHVGRKLR